MYTAARPSKFVYRDTDAPSTTEKIATKKILLVSLRFARQ
jgi:hypothetical protein